MSKKLTYLFLSLFLFTTLSGILRKWVFQSTATGNIVFGLLFLFPFIFLLIDNTNTRKIFSNKGFISFFLLLIVEAINPLNLTIYHGLLGILIYAYIWFLLFVYIENRELLDFSKLAYIFLVIIAAETVLGFIQYQLPPEHFLNKYADMEKVGGTIANVGNAVRITGTFSYIGGYTAFIIFYVLFVWYLFKINISSIITLLSLAAGIIAAFMTGSRSATYLYFIILLFFVVQEFRNFRQLNIRNLMPALLLLGMMYVLNGNFGSFQKKIEEVYQNFDDRRTELASQGEEKSRIVWDLVDLLNYKGNYPLLGVGLGSTYQGATALYGVSDYVKEYGYYEGELPRVVLEGGFLLLIARIALVIYFLSLLKIPPLMKVLFFLLLTYLVNYTFNIYNAIYLAFGIILLDNVYYHSSAEQDELLLITETE